MEIIVAQLTEFFNSFFSSSVLPSWIKWAAIGTFLLFVELGHRAWMIIWFALGALSASITAYFVPDNLLVQFAVFFSVSTASLGGFVYYRHQDEKSKPPTSVIQEGRKVRCTEEINGSRAGVIILDGVSYKARLEEPGAHIRQNEWVVISGFDVDELTAIVEPLERSDPKGEQIGTEGS